MPCVYRFEYGEEWHQAGTKLKKQNVFDDFIYAGKYLIDNGYTSSKKLCIQGGSNGGLLVGAVVNQAPDLFRVAFPAVGVMDMLRYQNFTIGRYWAVDYGTSADNEEMFEYLHVYACMDRHEVNTTFCMSPDRVKEIVSGHLTFSPAGCMIDRNRADRDARCIKNFPEHLL